LDDLFSGDRCELRGFLRRARERMRDGYILDVLLVEEFLEFVHN
jgi:hypothetical protein